MLVQRQKLSRDLMVGGMTVLVTLSGWLLNDRIHAAAKEQQFDDDAKTIVELKGKLEDISKDVVTRKDFDQVRQLIQNNQYQTISAINHLSDRIDHLEILDGRSSVQIPVGTKAATMAKARE
jgi:hypothetical protein